MKHNNLSSAILLFSLMLNLIPPLLRGGAGGEASAQNTFRYEICQDLGPLPRWLRVTGVYGQIDDIGNTQQVPSDSGYISFTGAIYTTPVYSPDNPFTWYNFSATKLDKYGNLEWVRAYPEITPAQDFRNKVAHDGIPTADGGFVMAGEKYIDPYQCCTHEKSNTCIQKMDKDGHLQWTKIYPLSDLNYALKILQMPDGGFIVMGQTEDKVYNTGIGYDESYNTYLLRLDAVGNKMWCYYYDAEKNGEEYPLSLDVTNDGGFIVGGWTSADSPLFNQDTLFSGQKGFMMKVSGDGLNVEWARRYGEVFSGVYPISQDVFYETKQTPDGGFISVGYTEPNGDDSKGWVVKTNALGKIEWQKSYDTWSSINEVEVVNDGYILGSTEYDGQGSGYGRLTKISFTGEVEWSKLYDNGILGVRSTMDKGLVVTQSRIYSASDYVSTNGTIIMKTNHLGEFENGCVYHGALSYQQDARIDTLYTLKPVNINVTPTDLLLNEVTITGNKICPVVCGISESPKHQSFSSLYHNDFIVGIACVGMEISITINQDYESYQSNFSHYKIDFGDPVSGLQNNIIGHTQSEYEQVSHTYSDTGTYTVSLVVYNGDYTLSDTTYTKVVVLPRPKITLLTPEIYTCGTDTIKLAAMIETTSPNQFYSVWSGNILSYGTNANVPVEDSVYVSDITVLASNLSDYYTISIADAYNSQCGVSDTIRVIKGDNRAVITGDTKICKGATASLKATGGDSYVWNTGAKTATITVNPTSNTTYWVEATTTDGCRDTGYVYVQVVSAINIAVSATKKAVCAGDTVTLYATGAQNYTWSNGSIGDTIQVMPTTGNNTYIATGTSGSCASTATIQITADPKPIVSISGLPVPVAYTCIGSTYTLTASGGERYFWVNSIVNSPEYTFLQYGFEGTLSVKAYNGGCAASAEIEIHTYTSPGITDIEADECRVCPGTEVTLRKIFNYVTFDQNPNDNPENQGLMYQWSTQTGISTSDSLKVIVNSDTTINLTTTNSNGCSVTHSTRLQAMPHFSIEKEVSTVATCANSPTTIYLMGEPLFDTQYDWGNGIKQDTLVVSPFQDSMLYVTATANGCTRTDSILVYAKSNLPEATITGDVLVCKGFASTYTASGNTSITNYQWLTDNSSNPTITIVSNSATTLKAAVTFTGGCKDTAEYKINAMDGPEAIITGDSSVCPGAVVVLKAGGGYTYNWSDGSSVNNINLTILADMPISLYAFKGNCVDTTSIVIKTDQTITATLFADEDTICAGTALTLIGGGGDDYAWNTGEQGEQIGISPTVNTTYTVSVTTNDNCLEAASINITVKPSPTVSISGETSVCLGNNVTLAATGSGTGYLWSTGVSTASITVNPAQDSTYSVSTFIDACSATQSHTVNVIASGINAGFDQTVLQGTSITLVPEGGLTYSWSTKDSVLCNNCGILDDTPTQTTTYYLSEAGVLCGEDSVTVYVLNCSNIFVPNAFSPNGDGINDILYLKNDCIKNLNFKIFDRWGNIVFESTNISNGWDGTLNEKAMDNAVFVYSVVVTMVSNETITKKGNVSLVR